MKVKNLLTGCLHTEGLLLPLGKVFSLSSFTQEKCFLVWTSFFLMFFFINLTQKIIDHQLINTRSISIFYIYETKVAQFILYPSGSCLVSVKGEGTNNKLNKTRKISTSLTSSLHRGLITLIDRVIFCPTGSSRRTRRCRSAGEARTKRPAGQHCGYKHQHSINVLIIRVDVLRQRWGRLCRVLHGYAEWWTVCLFVFQGAKGETGPDGEKVRVWTRKQTPQITCFKTEAIAAEMLGCFLSAPQVESHNELIH